MARKVIWSEPAVNDLEAAADYVARDSRHYAAALVAEVLDAARALANLSERGRRVPELEGADLRELFVKSYRLIYRVEPDVVRILALIHGRRDLDRAWGKERE